MTGAWNVHCDGSALPNPGRMGIGAVLVAPDGTRHALSRALAERGCNNEAELRALLAALQELKARGATAAVIHTDNSILVEQLGGGAARPIARLAALFESARDQLAGFDSIRLAWIPHRRNTEADTLARAALGMAPRAPARPVGRRRRPGDRL